MRRTKSEQWAKKSTKTESINHSYIWLYAAKKLPKLTSSLGSDVTDETQKYVLRALILDIV